MLHPTSLPGRHGIGDLGPRLTPSSISGRDRPALVADAAAGPDRLRQFALSVALVVRRQSAADRPRRPGRRGWLAPEACLDDPLLPVDQVDFDAVAVLKEGSLRLAYEGFKTPGDDPRFEEFIAANSAWLDDYVLYQALKDVHGGLPWYEWEPELVARDPSACARWRERLNEGIRYHEFVQYAFEIQWQALRAACREHGIMLIGDVPIFVAHDSADVWAQPRALLPRRARPAAGCGGRSARLFQRDRPALGQPALSVGGPRRGRLCVVGRPAPVPARPGRHRPDRSFRGFEAYWEIPPGRRRRRRASGSPGPGASFFEALRRRLGSLPLIAEDLGVITPGVEALRDEFGLPGMRVLQFGFGADPGAEKDLPHRFVPHCVVYTGHARQRHDQRLVHLDRRRDHAIPGRDRGRAGLRAALSEHATETRSTGT